MRRNAGSGSCMSGGAYMTGGGGNNSAHQLFTANSNTNTGGMTGDSVKQSVAKSWRG